MFKISFIALAYNRLNRRHPGLDWLGAVAAERLGEAMAGRRVPPRWLDCPRKGKLLAGKAARGRQHGRGRGLWA